MADDSGPESPEPPRLLRMWWTGGWEPTGFGNHGPKQAFFNDPSKSFPPGLGAGRPLRRPGRAARSHSFGLCDCALCTNPVSSPTRCSPARNTVSPSSPRLNPSPQPLPVTPAPGPHHRGPWTAQYNCLVVLPGLGLLGRQGILGALKANRFGFGKAKRSLDIVQGTVLMCGQEVLTLP